MGGQSSNYILLLVFFEIRNVGITEVLSNNPRQQKRCDKFNIAHFYTMTAFQHYPKISVILSPFTPATS